jgi:hypothetical protein
VIPIRIKQEPFEMQDNIDAEVWRAEPVTSLRLIPASCVSTQMRGVESCPQGRIAEPAACGRSHACLRARERTPSGAALHRSRQPRDFGPGREPRRQSGWPGVPLSRSARRAPSRAHARVPARERARAHPGRKMKAALAVRRVLRPPATKRTRPRRPIGVVFSALRRGQHPGTALRALRCPR